MENIVDEFEEIEEFRKSLKYEVNLKGCLNIQGVVLKYRVFDDKREEMKRIVYVVQG